VSWVIAVFGLYLAWATYENFRPKCDHCGTRQSCRAMYPNPADFGWSNSRGLCQSCAVADAINPRGVETNLVLTNSTSET
jgi:hypothetical protein